MARRKKKLLNICMKYALDFFVGVVLCKNKSLYLKSAPVVKHRRETNAIP
jgi:hypothetical protein